MTRDDIIRMAKKAGLEVYSILEKQQVDWDCLIDDLQEFAAIVAAAELEKVAAWMRSKSYVTGHGDTTEDLLKELEWQVAEREREACAKVCDEIYEAVPASDPYAEADGDYSELIYAGAAQDCAEAIRARGEQEQPR